VNLPVGVLGTLMVLRFVPNFKPSGRQKFDFGGALTLFISLFALLLALTMGQQAGFTSGGILLLFGIWLAFLLLFLVTEFRTPQPMIDLTMFKNGLFSLGLVTGFISFVTIAGTIILIPFYLETVLGYTTRQTGLLLAVIPVVLGVVAPLSGALSDRFGTRIITVIGLAFLVLGYWAMSSLNADTGTWGYIFRLLPIGLGMGVFQSPNNSAIMGAVSRQRLGIASGLLAVTRTLGQTTGIAVLGAIWAARVTNYTGEILPGGPTTAPITAQVNGLQDTFRVVIVLIFIALLLGLWGLVQARRGGRKTESTSVEAEARP
jgi:MFS family permease